MRDILKVQGVEAAIGTANTVGDASFVRILNKDAGLSLVTIQNIAANTATTLTLGSGKDVFIAKAPVDLVSANNSNVVAVGVKFF
jgi:hypothetical protein